MTELLFNAPLWLVVLLAVLGIGLLFSALRKGDARMRGVALGCFGVALVLLGMKYLAPTDQKRVEKETRRLADAVGKSDWPTVSSLLRDCTFIDLHGQEITDRVKSITDQYKLTELQINSLESHRAGSVITVTLSITTHHQTSYVDRVPSTWSMDWQKRSEGWILTDIHPLKIGTWSAERAEEFLRQGM